MKWSDVNPSDGTSATSPVLLRAAQACDEQAWQQLVETYSRRMYRWCRRAGLQPADAANVAQEALVAVARKLGDFRRDRPGDTFRGWLRRIVDNKIVDYRRLGGRRPDVAIGGTDACRRLAESAWPDRDRLTSGSTTVGGDAASKAFGIIVAEVREAVGERDWKFFWRVAVDGQSAADVGREFDVSANAVRLVKMRVLRRRLWAQPTTWRPSNGPTLQRPMRADVYGLGVTLHRLVTGESPQCGNVASLVKQASVSADAARLPSGLPRGLNAFIARMIAENPDDRVSSATEVAEAIAKWAERGELRWLVSRTLGGDSLPTDNGDSALVLPGSNSRWQQWRLSRRHLLLGAAASIGAIAMTKWMMAGSAPRLRRGERRDLAPASPEFWLAIGPISAIDFDLRAPNQVSLRTDDLTLVNMSRAAVGVFSLKAMLRQDTWQGGAGLFFAARRSGGDPSACEFQSIELRPLDDSHSPPVRRLLWSDWQVLDRDGKFSALRHPLAEAAIAIRNDSDQQLQVTLGRRGFPEVHWNNELLEESRWRLSSDARRLLGLTTDRAQLQFLGRLGLLNSQGETTFLSPQLAYL